MFNTTSANDSILNPDLIDYWNFEKINFIKTCHLNATWGFCVTRYVSSNGIEGT